MASEASSCSIDTERVFGPSAAASCLDGFDFTLLFEETILTILPLGFTLIWCALSVPYRQPVKVRASWHMISKLLAYTSYILLQIALLAVWARPAAPVTAATLPTGALTLGGFLVLMLVSYWQHTHSERPSTPLTVYMALSLLLDLGRARTLFYTAGSRVPARLFLTSYCFKIILFVLETIEKRRLLKPRWRCMSTEATSNVFSRSLFIWLNPLFLKGFRNSLSLSNLPPIDSAILSASRPVALEERWDSANKSRPYALLWTCVVHFHRQLLAGVIPRLLSIGFNFAQPFLIDRALDLTESKSPGNSNAKYGVIAAYAIVYIGIAVSLAVYEHKTYRALTMFRGSLITLIYSKILTVSSSAAPNAEAITLMSADVDRIGGSFDILHEWYGSLIELALALWLLYRYLGKAMAAPTAFVALCTILGVPIATVAGNAQVQWLEAIEARLATTATWLRDMKSLRMVGLAEHSASIVADLRSLEITSSLKYRVFGIFLNLASTISSMLTPLWAFGFYVLLAKSTGVAALTPGIAFATLSLLELQQQPVTTIVDAFEHFQTLYRCFGRIQDHLLAEERHDYRIHSIMHDDFPKSQEVRVQSLLITPLESEKKNIIATVRDVSVWNSSNDVATLKNLDFTLVEGSTTMILGPVGSGKSTLLHLLLGEVQKIEGSVYTSFSTAGFCPQSPWIICGSIRDNIVGESDMADSWYQVVLEACSLSTDIEELVDGDQGQTGSGGARLSGGQQMRVSLARALYSRCPVLILDDVLAGLDGVTEMLILDRVFGPDGVIKRSGTSVVLATHSVNHCRYAEHVILLDRQGRIAHQGPPATFMDEITKVESSVLTPSAAPDKRKVITESQDLAQLSADPDTSMHKGDLAVYAFYIRLIGWKVALTYLILSIAYIVTLNFSTVWLQRWTNVNTTHPNERVGYYLGVYGAIAGAAVVGFLWSDCLFQLKMTPITAIRFHELLLTTTKGATTSFLTSSDAGSILNRFSQDLELIDNDLPAALDQTILYALSALAEAVLVCLGSAYLAIGIPICVALLYTIQYYYLRTSRQMRLLDIEAKAPLFTSFLETRDGAACIRAYGWVEKRRERNCEILNESQKPYYLLWCIQRWLTLVLDLFVAGLATVVVATAMYARTPYLGVALFSLISFSSTLQALVAEWTQLETAIGAINRVRAFAIDTESEEEGSNLPDLPPDWPSRGGITIANVTASYNNASHTVLRQVDLFIHPGQKIAICGRTGSGKSSLISAVLRMLEIETGQIIIDGVDIGDVPRQELRKRLNTIPQGQLLLPGTVRENLDPLQLVDDERIAAVLERLNLAAWVEANGGLGANLKDESLSHAQKQIFSLARAVLRPGQIVIMDEVVSSVDTDGEEILQRLMKEDFQHRTVLAVAHRLDTVLDFDLAIVLDKGRVVETGNPRELLKTPTSFFSRQYRSR